MSDEQLVARFSLTEESLPAIFKINASGTTWGSISGNISNQTDLANALNAKQNVLKAGSNIQINGNVISATDTTYTAGTGISIENGVISNTQTSAEWGNIQGKIADQTDLLNALNSKQNVISDLSTIRSNSDLGANAYNTISGYGDIVTYNASYFATSSQGALADTALQPGDNISELVNDTGYITSAALPTNYVTTDTSQSVTGSKNFTQINNANGNNLAAYNSIQQSNDIGNTNENLRLQGNGDRPKYRSGSNVTSFIALQTDIQTYTAGTGIDITSNIVSVTSPTVIDNATGTHSIAIGDSSQSTTEGSVAVGDGSKANSTYSTVVGYNAQATNTNSVAIGKQAKATAARTVAIGSGAEANADDAYVIKGINNTANTFQVGSYTLLDTSTGLIPDARINSSTYATVTYVNDSISTNTAYFDGSWATYADVPTTVAGFTNENLPEPTNNNYLIVLEDETQDGGTWRYKYVDDGGAYDKANWEVEYEVNETPFTQAQLDAINSGITSADVSLIGTALQPNDNVSDLNNDAGYITGITSSDVTSALGYTPYNSTNPNGFISGVAWGDITGTLSSQTDLDTALSGKQATLVSGTNIKTINSTSLLGSGDLTVQEVLVSGTNIKTINNTSILGSGDITITAPAPVYDAVNERITWS